MEARSDDRCEVLLDIAELAAEVVGQTWLDEEVDRYLFGVFDLPPLAGRGPLLVDIGAGAGTAPSPGMRAEGEVGRDGVDASAALLLRCPMEHPLVVGHDEPHIGASSSLAEGEFIEKRGGGGGEQAA